MTGIATSLARRAAHALALVGTSLPYGRNRPASAVTPPRDDLMRLEPEDIFVGNPELLLQQFLS
jgi:hypothetical protein